MIHKPVTVDAGQCKAIAEILPELRIRPEFLMRPFLQKPIENETRLRMLFYAVAVCHQTRSLKSEKYKLYGWDYIEKVFLEMAENNSALIDAGFLNSADTDTIAHLLREAFSDNGDALNSTIDRVDERVKLMQELSNFVQSRFVGSFAKLLEQANGRLLNNGHGLYELLELTNAFSDPLRKKSSFLVKLLIDSNMFDIKDKGDYIPIMDYHMQRVLLRLGCVKVTDQKLANDLRNQVLQLSDSEVRIACIEAMKLLIAYSGVDPWIMNDIFWSLGRSCCNETTLCTDKCCMKDPCTFGLIVQVADHKNCSFESACKGFRDEETKLLREPIVDTHFY